MARRPATPRWSKPLPTPCAGTYPCPSYCRTNGSRATKPNPGWRIVNTTGASARRSWTRRPPPSSCRTISTRDRARLRMTRWIKRILLLLAALILAALAGGWWIYSRVVEPYRGYSGAEVFVDIPPGSGPARIGERLVEAGVVRDNWTFRAALLISGRARALKA